MPCRSIEACGPFRLMTQENRNSLLTVFDEFERYGEDRAVVYASGYRHVVLTYRQLASLARKYADLLRERGIGKGDRVLLWGANSGGWVAAFWGCQLVGAVAVPMDDGASAEFAARVAQDAGVKLILASRGKAPLKVAAPTLPLEDLADTGEDGAAAGDGVSRGTSRPERERSGNGLSRQDVAAILFTSGTTAEPRGVVLTHGNFLANLDPIERGIRPYLKYERWMHPLRFVSLVPLSHVFGQFMAMFVPPLLGATVVFENSTNPTAILRTMRKERATALIAVPRMLDLLRGAIEREIDIRGWRQWFDKSFAATEEKPFLRRAWRFRRIHRLFGVGFWAFICGGAALGGESELFFKRMGFAVVQGYGMTETASLISLNHPFSTAEGSVGKILPGREFKLAEDGEILVRGENVSSGYWERGALRQAGEHDGWLRTGDLGELDAQGNLKFRGRKKNVIVTAAGLNVYPEDLEATLKKQPAVRDAVVVPVKRDGNAEACAALLMREAGKLKEIGEVSERSSSAAAAAELAVAEANRGLAEYQQIRKWVVWSEPDFPRTATGKPRLGLIAEVAAAEEAGLQPCTTFGGAGTGRLDQLLESSNVARSLLSFSSLDRVELLSALEQRYNVEIDEEEFSKAERVADLQRLLDAGGAGSGQARGREPRAVYRYPQWAQWEIVRWLRLLVYYALVWPATQILGHPRVKGRENLRGVSGPVILVSNHITRRADMGLILAALPARFRHRLATAMGGETLVRMQRPPSEWFFLKRWGYWMGYWLVTALFNVFPLPQFSGFRRSFRFAGECADRGYSVLIFPEGEVNNAEDGRMAAFQSGIGLLTENLALPIVPMRLDGVWQMKRERRRLAHFGEITVHIGSPVFFPKETAAGEIAKQLEAIVAGL